MNILLIEDDIKLSKNLVRQLSSENIWVYSKNSLKEKV